MGLREGYRVMILSYAIQRDWYDDEIEGKNATER
jgi:hypothetical protein